MGRLRIIAGDWRGRRLTVIDDPGLRPTPDRVREALFNILGERVQGARVLDAYAGSGALGFEALSRGARHVVFVESSRAALRALERTRSELDALDRCRVVQGDVVALFERGALAGPYDLVMADPPYGGSEQARFLAALTDPHPLAPGGLVVVEDEVRKNPSDAALPAGWAHTRRAKYGRSRLDFYEPAATG